MTMLEYVAKIPFVTFGFGGFHCDRSIERKASDLNVDERQALYDAIKLVIKERIRLNGKEQFCDLYGNQGRYAPAMGPNMKKQICPVCGTRIEELNVGGGQVYFCPHCQV